MQMTSRSVLEKRSACAREVIVEWAEEEVEEWATRVARAAV